MWQPRRRCLRLLSLCVLSSLLVLIVRQTIGSGHGIASASSQSFAGYLGRLRLSVGVAIESINAASERAAVENWRSGYGGNDSGGNDTFRVTFPRLYASLRLLEGPPTVANFTPTGAAAATMKACQRPKSLSLADSLTSDGASPTVLTTPNREGAPLWAPSDCWPPLSRTAVIVPYRNRSDNLDAFVPYMQRLLRRQNLLFGLFVVEQANSQLFNRAKLLNVGFLVAQRFQAFDCFVFQDADKVPENAANLYDCANSPKLLISEMRGQDDVGRKYNAGRLYSGFFGGAVAVSREAFLKVNGNSNRYYGWGREDDELAARLGLAGFRIRYNTGVDGRFVNLRHGQDVITNTMPWPYAHKVRQTMQSDGLNSLNYTDRGIYVHPMFVLVRADV